LDDQCIGCQYCVLKCPYDVPKYSETKGIVRKCDMCQGRLAAGEAPACVQACPSGAIKIEIVRTDVVLHSTSNGARLIPGAVESSYTRPTTRFHSSKTIPDNARAADAVALRLEHPHWPLAIMLILTQLAAGVHAMQGWLHSRGTAAPYLALAITGLAALLAGMFVSFTHLGRPLKAWRAFLGLRRSWMSREIAAFSAYAGTASGLLLFPQYSLLIWATVGLGLISVACSAMIYIDTHRPFWAANRTLPKFFGTTALLGATTSAALFGWTSPALAPVCAIAATVIRTALFGWEWATFLTALRNPADATHRSALVLARLLRPIVVGRVILFVASTIFSVLAIFNADGLGAIWGTIAFVTTTTSQLLERHTYFTASAAPRMPGGVPA
jgi:DMSO reductase anchor subunit/NAD-dependent dihydropyrimidine dehydrogenase PreA subunit